MDYYGVPCKILPTLFPERRSAVVPRPIEGTLLVSTSELGGTIWGPPEQNPYLQLWHEKPVTNLGGHTLVFQGRFDMPLLSALSRVNNAQILADKGRFDRALAEARSVVEMAPQSVQAHLVFAEILAQAKQYSQARQEFSEAIRLAEMGEVGYYRIQVYLARKAYAKLDSAP